MAVPCVAAVATSCASSTAPDRCNPSLVGTWAADTPLPVTGLIARTLRGVTVTFARRTDLAGRCERVYGSLTGTGDDGSAYVGSLDDAASDLQQPPPPAFRFIVRINFSGGRRNGEGQYSAVMTGTFVDAATFIGSFSQGPGDTAQGVVFRTPSPR